MNLKNLRKDKKFYKKRDYYFKNYIGAPTSFVKLDNLTNQLRWCSNLGKSCL